MDRDTDVDWKALGEAYPYFGVVGDPRFRREHVSASLLDELYDGGEIDLRPIVDAVQGYAPDLRFRNILDFGCGVGRHTLPLAAHAPRVVGVDVAPGMTARAEEAAARRGITNCTFANLLPTDEKFDWINSYQVFQHIPPERGYEILNNLLQKLTYGGILSLHFTLFRESRHVPTPSGSLWSFDGSRASALKATSTEGFGQIILFDYDLNRLLALMISQHIEVLGISMTEHGGHHGALIFGRKRLDGLLLVPGERYEAQEPRSFGKFLKNGWSALEDWGVWSSGHIATLSARIDPGLKESHVLKLHGKAFVNAQHTQLEITVYVNSTLAAKTLFTYPSMEETLDFGILPIQSDGTAEIQLSINAPKSPVACGLPGDDTRELGFGLEAITLEPIG